MTAKEKLSQIKDLDTLIQHKTAEKLYWETVTWELATNVTSNMDGERVQSSGSKQRMADTVDSGLDRIRRFEKQIAELYAKMDALIAIIDGLPEEYSDILHKVYVQYMSLKEVAASRHESYSWVATNHGRALKMVSDILSGKESNKKQTKATKSKTFTKNQ
jgi:hypothetical protein